jgi:hypothetical protein
MNPLPPGYYGQAVLTIQNALVQQHFGPFLAHLPPRGHTPERFLATAKLGQLLEREFKNVALLLGRAAGGVFVGIAVKAAADQSRLPTTRYPEPSVGRGIVRTFRGPRPAPWPSPSGTCPKNVQG